MAPGRGTSAGSAHLRTPQRTVWGRFAGGWCRNPRLAGLDARHALWGLPSRLIRSALPAVAWGSAGPPAARAPPLCVGSLREARRAACGHPCRQAGTVLRRSASRPFGSHRHHVTATSLRFVPVPRWGSTRYAPYTQLSLRFGLFATPLRRGLQSGGARAFGACRPGSAPARGRALGRPKTDDASLSIFPRRLPRPKPTLRARLRRQRRDARFAHFDLPRARPGCHALRSFRHDGAAPVWAPLCVAAIRHRILRTQAARLHEMLEENGQTQYICNTTTRGRHETTEG